MKKLFLLSLILLGAVQVNASCLSECDRTNARLANHGSEMMINCTLHCA